MSDESPLRSGRKSDAGNGASEALANQHRYKAEPLFTHWDWQSVVRLNERLCGSGRAQHGKNSETHAACEKNGAKVSKPNGHSSKP